jgi:ubiquinone/menaquinone biosynthesis C-methylase UbiE
MFLNPFKRSGDDPYALVIGMTGIKMGDRLLQVGCAHAGRLGAIASKVGLSGRAVCVVGDAESAVRAQKGASDAGALVEVETTALTALPFDESAFDLAVVDDTGGLLASMRAESRVAMLRQVFRVLRPAGRVMVIAAAPRGGLGALVTRAQSGPPFDAVPAVEAEGFRAVRRLAEREGLIFVEGIKPRETAAKP